MTDSWITLKLQRHASNDVTLPFHVKMNPVQIGL